MKKRVVPMVLAVILAFSVLPTIAMAGGGAWIREADGTEYNLNQGSHSGDGWDWNEKTEVLTLNGFHGQAINFGYYGKKIVLAEGSNNTLSGGLYISPSRGLANEVHSVTVEGSGELIVGGLSISEFYGPVTIASPLQLTGGTETGSKEPLTLEYEPYAGAHNATYAGYKGGTGYPVTENGDRAKYIRIAPADSDADAEASGSPGVSAFSDVPTGEWYANPVTWAVEKGITNGTSTNTFSPNQNCSHAQILTFLWRAAGEPKSSATAPIALAGSEYYAGAIRWAAEKGMIREGFNLNADCTRSDAVNYIWQAFDSPSTTDSNFADVPANASYAKAVSWAVEAEVTNGTGNTTFSPDKVCSRGEIVTFLYRAYN